MSSEFTKQEAHLRIGKRVRLRTSGFEQFENGTVAQALLCPNARSSAREWCIVIRLDSGESEALMTKSAYNIMVKEL